MPVLQVCMQAFTAIVDSKFAVLGTVASPEPKARIHGHHETTVWIYHITMVKMITISGTESI